MTDKQYMRTMLLSLAGLAGLFFIAVSLGTKDIRLGEIWDILTGRGLGGNRLILLNVRLPRAFLAILVGSALALSGGILQAILKNPLADQGIIGLSSGAGFMAVVFLILLPEYYELVPLAAFSGALAAVVTVYLLSWQDGIIPSRVILAGVAVSSMFGAGISALLVFYSDRVGGALNFLNGNFSAKSWNELRIILPYWLILVPIALLLSGNLTILSLGDETAAGLGLRTGRLRLIYILIVSLLSGVCVSVTGLIGFVGLMVPHMVRRFTGGDARRLLPLSLIWGGILLLLSDTVGRTVLSPVEIPASIITAALGAPFFLYLLRKRRDFQ